MTLAAGSMPHRVRFERETTGDDGYGNVTTGAWSALMTAWCRVRPQKGTQSVEAGRMETTLRGVIEVHRSLAAAGIQPFDRAVFTAGPYAGRTVAIRAIVPSADASSIEFVFEEGTAT